VSTVDKLAAAPAVTQTGPVGEFQGRKCTWTYPRKEVVTDTAEIALTAWHGIEYYTPDTTGGFTAVAGIGDAAHVGPGMFMFRKGPDVFLVAVTGDSNLDALRPPSRRRLSPSCSTSPKGRPIHMHIRRVIAATIATTAVLALTTASHVAYADSVAPTLIAPRFFVGDPFYDFQGPTVRSSQGAG
jgi:hypothetical protein